jgi:hypothetical protein
MPTSKQFEEQLQETFRIAQSRGNSHVVVNAGALHRVVGAYPDSRSQRMPVCCGVMLHAMKAGDVIVDQPPKGRGAKLTIRYFLPRSGRK